VQAVRVQIVRPCVVTVVRWCGETERPRRRRRKFRPGDFFIVTNYTLIDEEKTAMVLPGGWGMELPNRVFRGWRRRPWPFSKN
jgi:hypothetical protein